MGKLGPEYLAEMDQLCGRYARRGSVERARDLEAGMESLPAGELGEALRGMLAPRVRHAVAAAYQNHIRRAYWGVDHHPDEEQFARYVRETQAALDLLEQAVAWEEAAGAGEAESYLQLIRLLGDLWPAASYLYGRKAWVRDRQLPAETQEALIQRLMACHRKAWALDPEHHIPPRPKPIPRRGPVGLWLARLGLLGDREARESPTREQE